MKNYDKNEKSKFIVYSDINNLYGFSMCQHLPTGNFRWMTNSEINKLDLAKYKDNSKKGLILEVDLEYPREIHKFHNSFLVAPEKNKGYKKYVIDVLQKDC